MNLIKHFKSLSLLLLIILFVACDIQESNKERVDNIEEQHNQKLNEIVDMLGNKSPADYYLVEKHINYILDLQRDISQGGFDNSLINHDIDSLLTALQEHPVQVEEKIISQDWLSGTKTTQSVKNTIGPFSSTKPKSKTTVTTNNNTEKKAKSIHDRYPSWDKEECLAIAEKKIWIGMSSEQLRESLGKPRSINRTVGSWGTHEQWVYGNFGPYVYVENEKVTSWQD